MVTPVFERNDVCAEGTSLQGSPGSIRVFHSTLRGALSVVPASQRGRWGKVLVTCTWQRACGEITVSIRRKRRRLNYSCDIQDRCRKEHLCADAPPARGRASPAASRVTRCASYVMCYTPHVVRHASGRRASYVIGDFHTGRAASEFLTCTSRC